MSGGYVSRDDLQSAQVMLESAQGWASSSSGGGSGSGSGFGGESSGSGSPGSAATGMGNVANSAAPSGAGNVAGGEGPAVENMNWSAHFSDGSALPGGGWNPLNWPGQLAYPVFKFVVDVRSGNFLDDYEQKRKDLEQRLAESNDVAKQPMRDALFEQNKRPIPAVWNEGIQNAELAAAASLAPGGMPGRVPAASAGTAIAGKLADEIDDVAKGTAASKGISNVPKDDFIPNSRVKEPYSRPSGAEPTAAQRAAVQGMPCVECGKVTPKQIADHIDPLSVQHYRDGKIDVAKQSKVEAVQPHCPDCSAKQGGYLSAFSKRMKSLFGW